MVSSTPVQEDWNPHSPIQEDWHHKEFEIPRTTMGGSEISGENSAPAEYGTPLKSRCCGSKRYIVDDPSGQRFDKSKFFDTEAESASLNRSFSSSSSLTFPLNKSAWICTKCRMPTTDQKRECGRIKDVKFYTCNACYRQFSLQMYLGMLFRMVQLHFCFTMVWIPSPDGAFFGDKMRNRGEFAGIVVLMVLTLLFIIASFINVVFVRQIAVLKRVQRKRPILDIFLEAICAACWVIVIGVMVFDGLRQYGSSGWNGCLIGLLACAAIMLISYLFTTIVAWMNLIKTTTTVIQGYPDPFAERRKLNISQAIAFLS